ncbi:PREDICTED: uncharacterized protein LOC107186634 [Dufourea novaeangliae]|uniref:Uncharacterized protein n=1 Tax=Dufourea novaeangliae TaxID=178035 RepID=A0A154P9B8_DUFNO|nr:PREDICTED: uncharacterized protein LOC107186634 [Dufourea novaeangliae]KZC08417.1 hypothetical protein WN55_09321 [Dufourea novaeangliae]
MALWTSFSVAILLIGNAVADIMLQPGYGHPQPAFNSQPLVQPLSTLHHGADNVAFQQQREAFDPGYHFELHPVYGHLQQHLQPADGSAFIPSHDLSPYMSRTAYRRLTGGKMGGLGLVGPPAILPHQYLPLAVHNRHRRSSDDESSVGVQREKRDKSNVAAKSTLNQDVPSVVDLQSQNGEATKNLDEKRVEVRQSKNDQANAATLLGINPSRMYPVQNHYRYGEPDFNSYQPIISSRLPMVAQLNTRAAMQEQTTSQHQAGSSMQNSAPRMNPEDYQHAILRQAYQEQQQQQQQNGMLQATVQDQRNAPDPRPVSTTPNSSTEPMTTSEDSKSETLVAASNVEPIDDKNLMSSRCHHHHHHATTYLHHHGMFRAPNTPVSTENYAGSCMSPNNYMVYNDNYQTSSNVPLTQLGGYQSAQVYQLSAIPQSYPTIGGYVFLPEAYNYINSVPNHDWKYPAVPQTTTYCLQQANTVPTVAYQFM